MIKTIALQNLSSPSLPGKGINHVGVAKENSVQPTTAAFALRSDANLTTNSLKEVTHFVLQLRRKWPVADTSAVGLRDAVHFADEVRWNAETSADTADGTV